MNTLMTTIVLSPIDEATKTKRSVWRDPPGHICQALLVEEIPPPTPLSCSPEGSWQPWP